MYRSIRIRIQAPFPITRFTAEHPGARVVVYTVARETDTPLPFENLYIARVPQAARDAFLGIVRERLEVIKEIPSPEPGVSILHGRFRFPETGPVRAFLQVLGDALGTVLSFQPSVIERGHIDVAMLTLPRDASTLRLRAIEEYARGRGIGFEILEDRAVPHLPIEQPRLTVLDLLEGQVLQALDAAGVYADPAPEPAAHAAVLSDLADALGMGPQELEAVRRAAEHKVLHEFARVRARNVALATPPGPDDPPAPS